MNAVKWMGSGCAVSIATVLMFFAAFPEINNPKTREIDGAKAFGSFTCQLETLDEMGWLSDGRSLWLKVYRNAVLVSSVCIASDYSKNQVPQVSLTGLLVQDEMMEVTIEDMVLKKTIVIKVTEPRYSLREYRLYNKNR